MRVATPLIEGRIDSSGNKILGENFKDFVEKAEGAEKKKSNDEEINNIDDLVAFISGEKNKKVRNVSNDRKLSLDNSNPLISPVKNIIEEMSVNSSPFTAVLNTTINDMSGIPNQDISAISFFDKEEKDITNFINSANSVRKIIEEEKESSDEETNKSNSNKFDNIGNKSDSVKLNLSSHFTHKKNYSKTYIIPTLFDLNNAIQVKLDFDQINLKGETLKKATSALEIAESNGVRSQNEQGVCFKVTKEGLYVLKIQGNKLENCRIFGSFDKEGFLVLDDKVSVNKTKHNSNNSHYQIHNNKLIKQNINLPKTINRPLAKHFKLI